MLFPSFESLERVGVVIIDLQSSCFNARELCRSKTVCRLFEANKRMVDWSFKRLQRPPYVVEFKKFPGSTVTEVLGDRVVDPIRKDSCSAFDGTDFARRLRADGISSLLVGGINTSHCVASSIFGALKEGVGAVLPSDAHADWMQMRNRNGFVAYGPRGGLLASHQSRDFSCSCGTAADCLGLCEAAGMGRAIYEQYCRALRMKIASRENITWEAPMLLRHLAS